MGKAGAVRRPFSFEIFANGTAAIGPAFFGKICQTVSLGRQGDTP